ncbi:DUF1206 domain-containing protein [Pontivivens ytuae]|uniref:DUF1206 domain-containing protein n=1 Tax=Pontivivens ytuae TaxID=2789856 RepID=A0A7S9LTJ2_9RHOB|nr:DUF1206 domain-containing protein [Pontivivens ytuae]QPH54465.1 DUF1206 domain-containing protein [Pontivivens ytuae]
MSKQDLSWAIPVMRMGYAGRGIVYVVVAGISLFALTRGGEAEGTSSALEQLEGSAWGSVVLLLIFLGMAAYAIWRWIDAAYDLEDYGGEVKGLIARGGMIITGAIHGALGLFALVLLFTSGGGGSGSTIAEVVRWVMGLPAGIWLVGLAGAITIGAGIYYVVKAVKEKYRAHLRANHFTRNWNPALKAGVLAQAIIITLIGFFLVFAAWQADPSQAGGVGEAFSWLRDQAHGRILVIAVCIGLLGFALFCFVNAAYRVVPKVAGDDVETLARRAKGKAEAAMG